MKRLLIFLAIAMLVVPGVSAFRASMQNYDPTNGGTGGITPTNPVINPSLAQVTSNGEVYLTSAGSSDPQVLIYLNPTTSFTYAAFDLAQGGSYPYISGSFLCLYDSYLNQISIISFPSGLSPNARYELKIIGGTPTLFKNGVQIATGSSVNINPSYIGLSVSEYGYITNIQLDNIVMGENDHHVVGSIPTNWSLQRDFLNSAATGVYGLTLGGGSTWTLKNSQYFYIDADTDSTDATTTENFQITNVATGAIVNNTVIDSTVPSHYLQYDLNQFLSQSNVADGEYAVGFNGSTVREYLWVISNGASINWDKTTYTAGSTATLTYTMTTGYYLPTTYTYSYAIVDVYGNVITTGAISSASGTFTISTTGYTPGVYYAEIRTVAIVGGTTPNILAYSGTTVTNYISFSGTVYSAQSASPLSGASINITQAATSTVNAITSGSVGNYTATGGYLSGSLITVSATASGYIPYNYSFTPLSAKAITLDFSLVPTSPSVTGIGIGGVARDTTYGEPISGATVVVQNLTNSQYYMKTTNADGWYLCDSGSSCSLTNSGLYSVWGSGTRHLNSSVYTVVASGS